MFLKEFTNNPTARLSKLTRSLKENYNYELDMDNMSVTRAKRMIKIAETRAAETNDSRQRIKLGLIAESLTLWHKAAVQTELTDLTEGLDDDSVEEAKVILAAKEISDKIQGMIEDAAKMQVQDLLPIVDAMKTEVGSEEADAFSNAADTALAGLVDSLKSAKEEFDGAIGAAQGNAPAVDMDAMGGDDADLGSIGDMEVDMDAMDDDEMGDGELDLDDEFGGDAAEIGDDEPTGRELKDEG